MSILGCDGGLVAGFPLTRGEGGGGDRGEGREGEGQREGGTDYG